jgi:DNA-binding CsgD family transcriptional regulator
MPGRDRSTSLVDVVEAAYTLDGDHHAWLTRLAEAARPSLDRGLGVVAYVGETRTLRPVDVAMVGVTEGVHRLLRAVGERAAGEVDETYLGQPMRFVSVSETTFFGDALRSDWEETGRACGLVDGVSVYVHSTANRTVHLFAGSASLERPSARERRAWLRVASHIAAGHRVLTLLSQGGPMDAQCDAVFDPCGRLLDARNEATTPTARKALRDAVCAMERARGPMRNSATGRALELWRGLVAGRWSLVDRWDSDGRRFIVAIENAPESVDPRALRPREGAVARLAAEGAGPKDIAYALGISQSNARAVLASALAKLGLSSRAELFRWNPAHAHVHALAPALSLEALVILERPPSHLELTRLTEAERTVARLAADGMTNHEIARTRGTSVRTTANQMAGILRKLGVASRADILRGALTAA